jgi:extracellular factor (EF) 3-hydroxypalmitic acid methyl ester biosynthesis protein
MLDTVMGDGEAGRFFCRTSQGLEVAGTILKLSRFVVSFEAAMAPGAMRLSEVLTDVRIVVADDVLYSGRAVARGLIDTGTGMVCEVTLDESGFAAAPLSRSDWLVREFHRSFAAPRKLVRMLPEFKLAVTDLQLLLADLRNWLGQVELRVNAQPAAERAGREREILLALRDPAQAIVARALETFETAARSVPPEHRALHMNYLKRQLHPLVLCAPFIHRTFFKPLGYAGDYEMVNMMVRDPHEGASLFAKVLNYIFLRTPPVEAHRRRLVYLGELLRAETLRALRQGRRLRVLNLGCGPAKEIQDFLAADELCNHVEFTLWDFDAETLDYASGRLRRLKQQCQRQTGLEFEKRAVHQLLKEAARAERTARRYDLVYCAGLFDYLSDPVSRKLLGALCARTQPGGRVVVTNVADNNPSVHWMEGALDWHLIYRNAPQLRELHPAPADTATVQAIGDGVNLALEVAVPEPHA